MPMVMKSPGLKPIEAKNARSSSACVPYLASMLPKSVHRHPGALPEDAVRDDGRVADALQLVEGGLRQGQSLPADLQPAIGKVINVDQLARHCCRCLIGPQHELHAVVIDHELSRDRTLFAPAQDVVDDRSCPPSADASPDLSPAAWRNGHYRSAQKPAEMRSQPPWC
jgi:hypothetical protein